MSRASRRGRPYGRPAPARLASLAALAALVSAGVLLAGGCARQSPLSGDYGTGKASQTAVLGADGVQSARLAANDSAFDFDPPTILARPGDLRLTLAVTGATPHNLYFTDGATSGAGVAIVYGGSAGSVTVHLPGPGTYHFVCRFHENLGMKGQVVVS